VWNGFHNLALSVLILIFADQILNVLLVFFFFKYNWFLCLFSSKLNVLIFIFLIILSDICKREHELFCIDAVCESLIMKSTPGK